MSVACGGRRLAVAKKFADHRQAHSGTGGDAGKAVTKVMDAHAVEVRSCAYASPSLVKIDQWRACLLADYHVRVSRNSGNLSQQANGRFVEEDILWAGLGIRAASAFHLQDRHVPIGGSEFHSAARR